jgi:hypothetical protein
MVLGAVALGAAVWLMEAWLGQANTGSNTGHVLAEILLFFTKAGAFVFGSGLAIVPFLHQGVVQQFGWLNEHQFLDAVAVAMITPGPVVITVAFIGFLVAGLAGSIMASIGIFLPVYIFTIVPAPWFKRHRDNPQLKAFVDGATAAATGAITGAVIVLGLRAITDIPTAIIALVSLVVLWRYKIGEPIIVTISGLIGLILWPLLRGGETMKWVTRARPKVDRVACPWLIKRFVDPQAEFLYVPTDQVMEVANRKGAIPFDVSDVELGHHGPECTFDAIIRKYNLTDPALQRLAPIVRGADTDAKDLTPESRGLEAIAEGFRLVYQNDHELLERESSVYDALYAYCRETSSRLKS